ncbi:hypothetical protein B0H63DRAFT_404453 [Podospora didyma]|uniref:Homeobox domain-containing protein n=1 Tax=Podospora didyma TaxID=330526 RepID=A0AAE0N2X8_9PEZI|nr:hypothetical protein B0H63DRAFT_404453 [Podospora didyma]
MLHWQMDDLWVLPELEDLEKCLRDEFSFDTEIFSIPSENPHLELMLKIGDMVKNHESEDTLLVVYYGGHARIDESRQSTWCATRRAGSPTLQWSAIQTLLERSISDVLILLDCCAGAASATFPTGQSMTETISASSWDAIAPDPGRYSFTNALIEVLQEWRHKTFSAAMLHAEILARLKHPRPILINGKRFEARATPVHFMMTSNHKTPSIELCRLVPQTRQRPVPETRMIEGRNVASPFGSLPERPRVVDGRNAASPADALIPVTSEPNENEPHVMISLALEDDQQLDLNAWEQWLASFPSIAKYVKVQGVFKSHSTLLLLSLPVMVWDLLPDDPACAFIAFIRSNNLLHAPGGTDIPPPETQAHVKTDIPEPKRMREDTESIFSGTTFNPGEETIGQGGIGSGWPRLSRNLSVATYDQHRMSDQWLSSHSTTEPRSHQEYYLPGNLTPTRPSLRATAQVSPPSQASSLRNVGSATSLSALQRQQSTPSALPGGNDNDAPPPNEAISRTMILNRSRNNKMYRFDSVLEGPKLASHVVKRLEEYFHKEPEPNVAVTEFLASNLGVETSDINAWFHNRRQQERMTHNLQNLRLDDHTPEIKDGARMILPGHLNTLLEIYPSKSVLILDLRSATDFEKSHIHDAVNLRAPLSFIQNTSLEMIEDTLVDDQSRRSFSKWSQCRCVVFYDRVIEFGWECPVAESLYDKFKKKRWTGQCFILKGHYREFSASFDKYISGSKMSKEAKEYLDGLRQRSSPTQEEANERHRRYDEWLGAFSSQDRVPVMGLIPAKKEERINAVTQHQRELEIEFKRHFSALYRKAQAMRSDSPSPPPPLSPPPPFKSTPSGPWVVAKAFENVNWTNKDDNFSRKAALVEPLASGLDKMREAGGILNPSDPASKEHYVQGYGADNSYADKYDPGSDDYDEIDPKREGLKNDPAFQKAGAAKPQQETSGGDDDLKKGRKRPPLWGRIRTAGK